MITLPHDPDTCEYCKPTWMRAPDAYEVLRANRVRVAMTAVGQHPGLGIQLIADADLLNESIAKMTEKILGEE